MREYKVKSKADQLYTKTTCEQLRLPTMQCRYHEPPLLLFVRYVQNWTGDTNGLTRQDEATSPEAIRQAEELCGVVLC